MRFLHLLQLVQPFFPLAFERKGADAVQVPTRTYGITAIWLLLPLSPGYAQRDIV